MFTGIEHDCVPNVRLSCIRCAHNSSRALVLVHCLVYAHTKLAQNVRICTGRECTIKLAPAHTTTSARVHVHAHSMSSIHPLLLLLLQLPGLWSNIARSAKMAAECAHRCVCVSNGVDVSVSYVPCVLYCTIYTERSFALVKNTLHVSRTHLPRFRGSSSTLLSRSSSAATSTMHFVVYMHRMLAGVRFQPTVLTRPEPWTYA